MKALIIHPPLIRTFTPPLGPALTIGNLAKNGYREVESLDLNIKFFWFIYEILSSRIQSEQFAQLNKNNKYSGLIKIFKNVDEILQQYKNKNTDVKNIQKLIDDSNAILNVWRVIEKCIATNKGQVFKDFFKQFIKNILKKEYDYIGLIVNSNTQYNSALTFAKILRESGFKGHINLCGFHIQLEKFYIKKNTKLFENYIDSFIIGAGEFQTHELFEYIEEKRKISDVSNIIYMDENKIIQHNEERNNTYNRKNKPVFNGYNFKEYPVSEPLMQISASSGCYRGNCVFCIYNQLTKYKQRNVDDVIEQIKELINKYNVHNFVFTDAALSPSFLEEFSTKIINEHLEIYYIAHLRFENNYTKEFLKKLYSSGLRVAKWGLESASERILKLMRKGISVDVAENILKNSNAAGISNVIYYMYEFPTETEEDFKLTFDFIERNKQYLSSAISNEFTLNKYTYIYEHLAEFGINPLKVEEEEKKLEKKYRYFL